MVAILRYQTRLLLPKPEGEKRHGKIVVVVAMKSREHEWRGYVHLDATAASVPPPYSTKSSIRQQHNGGSHGSF